MVKMSDTEFRLRFEAMRLSDEMCDVTLVVEGQEIKGHRVILAGGSKYFRAMFRDQGFGESKKEEIEIDPKGELGISAEAVGDLVKYIYTGQISINQQNVIDLIQAADLLELTEVRNQSLEVIEKHVTFDTYLDVQRLGQMFHSPRLFEAVDKFISKNFAKFVKTDSFIEMDEDALIQCLTHDKVRTTSEEVVLEALMYWCHKNDCFADAFTRLASKTIRFGLISVKFLIKNLQENEEIRSNPDISDFFFDQLQSLPRLDLPSRPRFPTRVLIIMPYRCKTFYLVSFSGKHVDFVSRQFPKMVYKHIDALVNYSICKGNNR